MKISSLDELKTEVGHVYCYDSSSEDVRSKMVYHHHRIRQFSKKLISIIRSFGKSYESSKLGLDILCLLPKIFNGFLGPNKRPIQIGDYFFYMNGLPTQYRVSLSLTPRAGGWEQRAVVGKLCGQHAYLFGSSLWAPLISLTWKFFHLPITIVAFGRTVRSIKL